MNNTKRPTSENAENILYNYYPVLDHGFVSLVDYQGTDQCIERAARTSYGAGTRKLTETRGLLRYLKRHKHTTPFEMVEMKFHCSMPIFIARQWIRHRTANVNEASGRYSLMPMLFYTPSSENFSSQSKDNKQGRGDVVESATYDHLKNKLINNRVETHNLYKEMIDNDVARELARIDLPLSTYTQWYWKIDLHNLMHFLKLRVHSHAQFEIREYAKVMAGMFKEVAPLAYEAWIDYDVCGDSLSFQELDILRNLMRISDGKIITQDNYTIEGSDEILSTREQKEFLDKLSRKEKVDFSLDNLKYFEGSYFEEKMKVASI
jgi:thymidylate synthase (FAD)